MYIEVEVNSNFGISRLAWNTNCNKRKAMANFRKDHKIGKTYHNIPDTQITFLL